MEFSKREQSFCVVEYARTSSIVTLLWRSSEDLWSMFKFKKKTLKVSLSISVRITMIRCIYTRILSSPKHSIWLWGPPSALYNHYWGSFPWVKRPGCKITHSPPSSVNVKSEWSHISVPPNTFMAWTGQNLPSPLLRYVVGCLKAVPPHKYFMQAVWSWSSTCPSMFTLFLELHFAMQYDLVNKMICVVAACIICSQLQWHTQDFFKVVGRGGSPIQWRTEVRENGDLGAVAP
jgi:hypothetical protein